MSKWTPVKDKLPKLSGRYLITEECEGRYCCGDCDKCDKEDEEENDG